MFLEGTASLHRALRRRFRAGVKDQPHVVARWNLNYAAGGFGFLILIRTADDFGQLVNHHPLFINRKLRVADDVDEQDVRDLKLDLLFNFSGHLAISRIVRKSLSYIKLGEPRSFDG